MAAATHGHTPTDLLSHACVVSQYFPLPLSSEPPAAATARLTVTRDLAQRKPPIDLLSHACVVSQYFPLPLSSEPPAAATARLTVTRDLAQRKPPTDLLSHACVVSQYFPLPLSSVPPAAATARLTVTRDLAHRNPHFNPTNLLSINECVPLLLSLVPQTAAAQKSHGQPPSDLLPRPCVVALSSLLLLSLPLRHTAAATHRSSTYLSLVTDKSTAGSRLSGTTGFTGLSLSMNLYYNNRCRLDFPLHSHGHSNKSQWI
ncbi:hypothetical protein J6590_048923 [Homalodisca vitripennis]|nr:hypothetical protein J6590_048923 [Homalodisca vitripennis]